MSEAELIAERDRYRVALERIQTRSRKHHDFYTHDRKHPTKLSRSWSDGFGTALSTCSLIADEALNPEAFAESEAKLKLSGTCDDKRWFAETGNCGHCGNPAIDCTCTPDDPCDCGPHETRGGIIECLTCEGAGHLEAPAVRAHKAWLERKYVPTGPPK